LRLPLPHYPPQVSKHTLCSYFPEINNGSTNPKNYNNRPDP
jgi:hypothetical protein